jgi:fumarate hydratase class II
MSEFRIEKDSMGEVQVPKNAYYQAQTQRAVNNFPVSGIRIKDSVIKGLGLIKKNAAKANLELKLIPENIAQLIIEVSDEIIAGKHNDQFPIDIFQTGSGTSSNMNANEVISSRANEIADQKNLDLRVHPNDHVNFGQSSNDVFPTALRIAAMIEAKENLIPKLDILKNSLLNKGKKYAHVVKTGKTHLMDAMPVTFEQVFGGYARQVELGVQRVQSTFERLSELPQGGTAVGTGINTHPQFGEKFAAHLAKETNIAFTEAKNHFEAQATLDAPNELSAQLKTFACSLMKIANDFRWMNSGPNSGISEIKLAALQPGSSIMPGKVNPVIEESVCMVCAQVIGNDAAVTIGAQSGSFELNVMFPMVAHNILESISILSNACENFAKNSVDLLEVNEKNVNEKVSKNPILVTALNPIIGYDLAAKIAKKSYAEDRPLLEVAKEMCDVSEEELKKALDPMTMTKGGFSS